MPRFYFYNFSDTAKIWVKIGVITAGTVYGGHKLVQYVTPTEEELLKAIHNYFQLIKNNILFRGFLKSAEIVICFEWRDKTNNSKK